MSRIKSFICNQKGISLIELMTVVAIVSILTAIAVPSYEKYVRRGKQVEAKTLLIKLYAKETAFIAEWSFGTPNFHQLGFLPKGDYFYNAGWEKGYTPTPITTRNINQASGGCSRRTPSPAGCPSCSGVSTQSACLSCSCSRSGSSCINRPSAHSSCPSCGVMGGAPTCSSCSCEWKSSNVTGYSGPFLPTASTAYSSSINLTDLTNVREVCQNSVFASGESSCNINSDTIGNSDFDIPDKFGTGTDYEIEIDNTTKGDIDFGIGATARYSGTSQNDNWFIDENGILTNVDAGI